VPTTIADECIDWHVIKDRIDLEAVAVAVMGPPQGRRGGRGLWWVCPFHADRNPSFSVDPARRRWKCWGCGAHGDAAELVMRSSGVPFPEAVRHVAELCGLDAPPGIVRRMIRPPNVIATGKPPDDPIGLPTADASALVEEATRRLWTPQGAEALSYLRGDRGLTDETIRTSRLGCVHDAAIPTREGDRSYRASGVVIPWFEGGRLASAKVRQFGDRKPKYAEAYRDRPRVYPGPSAIHPGRPLVVVEGEFDALLLGQHIGDVAAVVTLGSASTRTADDIRRAARACTSLYVAHDADDAGDRAAAKWPARAIRVRPPAPHNDWTEVYANGFSRIRYFWGEHLPISISWEQLKDSTWGSTDEPYLDPDGREEREAIQSEAATRTPEQLKGRANV
jgi:DNA primase